MILVTIDGAGLVIGFIELKYYALTDLHTSQIT
jgi:hypothetical protein